MLLLFDIDGTLLSSNGAGRRALAQAFREAHGIEDAMSGVRLDGNTDLRIVEDAFLAHLGRPPMQEENDAVLERYLEVLQRELAALGDRYQLYEGARELAAAGAASPRHAVGLATGNVERGARIKLEPAGINALFPFGGFGCDHPDRGELVQRGVERGQAWAEAHRGRRYEPHEIFVIGDTERDVLAARFAGVRAVGVLAGCRMQDDLRKAAPDLLVSSLADPELWRALGL